jgi:hypothetical protein
LYLEVLETRRHYEGMLYVIRLLDDGITEASGEERMAFQNWYTAAIEQQTVEAVTDDGAGTMGTTR